MSKSILKATLQGSQMRNQLTIMFLRCLQLCSYRHWFVYPDVHAYRHKPDITGTEKINHLNNKNKNLEIQAMGTIFWTLQIIVVHLERHILLLKIIPLPFGSKWNWLQEFSSFLCSKPQLGKTFLRFIVYVRVFGKMNRNLKLKTQIFLSPHSRQILTLQRCN